jgi:ribulose kinase
VRPLLLAVGVDAAAAHAGLFNRFGKPAGAASRDFETLRPATDHEVHRMDAIWDATVGAIADCLGALPGAADRVVAIGFSAMPALVLEHDGPPPLAGGADVFGVADHRAVAEAADITAAGEAVSASMHLPRLLWLRRRSPATWARVTAARDLCDELARRATGIDAVSFGSLVTQWPFVAENGWRQALLDQIRLDDLPLLGALGSPPRMAGQVHGPLAPAVAASLGLPPGLPVAAGLIDSHAAALGVLGRGARARLNRTFLLVAGDPARGLAFAPEARAIAGVQGPFRDAILPGFWLHVADPADLAADVIAQLNANGYAIDRVTIAGNHVAARRFRETLAADVVLTEAAHPALSGAAMAAAVAGDVHPDLFVAVDLMSPPQYRFAAAKTRPMASTRS